MTFQIQQSDLHAGLTIVSRAVATRSTLPVLSNILVAGEGDALTLTATNLEISLRVGVEAVVGEAFKTTLPAKLFTEFVGSLPDEEVRGEYDGKVEKVHLECAGFEANVKGIDADEFPSIPEVEDGFTLPAEMLKRLIDLTTFNAATDESRPILTGVLVELGDGITLAAADGFRLGVASADIGVDQNVEVIPPARALQELARLLGEGEVQVAISEARSQIMFETDGVELVSQLIEGNYPDYGQIIPETWGTRIVADCKEFLGAVRGASFFSREAANIVRLKLEKAGMTWSLIVSGRSVELGDYVASLEGVGVEGDEIEIAFNAKYLADVLSACPTEEVMLELQTGGSPGVFKPVGADGVEWTAVVMPMRVRS